MITQEYLKSRLHYDPDTGMFTHLTRKGGVELGSVAGSPVKDGYIKICLIKKNYSAHRLAFLYMEGTFPPDIVHHMNDTVDDNRWENLMHSTQTENQQIRRSRGR